MAPMKTAKKTRAVGRTANEKKVSTVPLGFVVTNVTFSHQYMCVGRKKMNATLPSTATGSQVYVRRILTSKMERPVNIEEFVSVRAADPGTCSARIFLEMLPGRLLTNVMM